MVEGREIALLLDALDEKSKALLLYLWWYRHADIFELRHAVKTSSDFEILHRLKDIINVRSAEILGKPIISFEESKIDPLTGKKVLFNWWFLEDATLSQGDRPLIDAFEERERFVVIVQVPNTFGQFDVGNSLVEYKNGVLKITLHKESQDAD